MTAIGCLLGKIQGYKILFCSNKPPQNFFVNYPKSLKHFLLAEITEKRKTEQLLHKLTGRMGQIVHSCDHMVQLREKTSA